MNMKHTPFSDQEQEIIAAIVSQIIPESIEYAQPGADDPDILNDILGSGGHLREKLTDALASLAGTTVDATRALEFRKNFALEAELLQTLAIQCYYRDERVMRALKIDVRPPFPKGYTQEPNDFSLLDAVRKRGEIYRKTV